MSKSIRLSKEHGLNPTLCTCFYCGKETGEIALLGDNYKGEAPMHMCVSLEPCDECKKKFEGYVLVVEVIDGKQNPTGRWVAIKKEYVNVQNKGICLCLEKDFNEIIKGAKNNE